MSFVLRVVFIISLTANLLTLLLLCQNSIFSVVKTFARSIIHTKTIQTDNLRPVSIYDDGLIISGLPFVVKKGDLCRLPKSIKSRIRPVLWKLGRQPSGGRIRFKTDSSSVVVIAKSFSPSSYHMNSIMKNGVDIYVNDIYTGSAWPDINGEIEKQFYLGDKKLKNITIYLPLYSSIRIHNLYIGKDAVVAKPDDLKSTSPIVYYGSSITQGASASNPGLSYPAIISRHTGIDFINFGFSANGLGDIEIAKLIGTIDSSLIVLDYWANPTSAQYKKSLPDFVDAIRKKKKNIPILVISPFYSVGMQNQRREKREIAFDFVAERKKMGDSHIYIFDGEKMLSKDNASGLVDGVHLNSLGFWFSANALEPKILELINQ
jgi:lysophospholipase L1-like esterase